MALFRTIGTVSTIYIKEGVTLTMDQAAYSLALYYSRDIPEGYLISKGEIEKIVRDGNPSYFQNLILEHRINPQSPENLGILRQITISDREKRYMENIPKIRRGGNFTVVERNWAYPKDNWAYPKSEFETRLSDCITTGNEEKEREQIPPKDNEEIHKKKEEESGGEEAKTQKNDWRQRLTTWSSVVTLGLGAYTVYGYLMEFFGSHPNLAKDMEEKTEELIKKRNKENPQWLEELGFPPGFTFEDSAIDIIRKTEESKKRISRLQEMGGFDINAEIEKFKGKK